MQERTWKQETEVRLESLMVAYYLSIKGLPKLRSKVLIPTNKAKLSIDMTCLVQTKMEISNAFFLRLKGLMEARIKLAGFEKINWQTDTKFVVSIGIDAGGMDEDDRRMFSQLCALRNCLAHNYGLVDAGTNAKIPALKIDSFIEIDEVVLKNWFIFAKRIFLLIDMAMQNKQATKISTH